MGTTRGRSDTIPLIDVTFVWLKLKRVKRDKYGWCHRRNWIATTRFYNYWRRFGCLPLRFSWISYLAKLSISKLISGQWFLSITHGNILKSQISETFRGYSKRTLACYWLMSKGGSDEKRKQGFNLMISNFMSCQKFCK